MSRTTSLAVAIAVATGLMLGMLAPATALTCINKAGQGTGSNDENAKFQAWEAVLQATSWPMWSSWMASSQKVGVAPGYKVSNLKSKCTSGGLLGRECIIQARLCQ
jgi:hypothetical protein